MRKKYSRLPCGAAREGERGYFVMSIIPHKIFRDKRLQKLMGDDYNNPAMRLMVGLLENAQSVDSMDNGLPVDWDNLVIERERKIAIKYFWHGVAQAEQWVSQGVL